MIFSIDVEDWTQSVMGNLCPELGKNHPVTHRVYDSTNKVMDILAEHNAKGTFFTLGNVAEKHPTLIQRMVNEGHEVASHGCEHTNIYAMSPKHMLQDITRSVQLLEDAGGQKVIGFRAPNFSIREHLFEEYCDALQANGIRYDSSLFPMKALKYGIEKKYDLDVFDAHNIDEYYLSHIKLMGMKLPFFGGGYFRLAPYALTRFFSKNMPDSSVFYIHPYDFDPGEELFARKNYGHIPLVPTLTQFIGRPSMAGKLSRLLTDHEMTSFQLAYYSEDSVTNPNARPAGNYSGHPAAVPEDRFTQLTT